MNRFMQGRRWLSLALAASLVLAASLMHGAPARAQSVGQIQVRIETGDADLAPGSYVELRIYEVGGGIRKLPLTHGEGWPRASTRIIPLRLDEPLDPRRVVRFSLYYRAAHPAAPAWSVMAADVDLAAGRPPAQLLLATTLSGALRGQGELESPVRDASTLMCMSDAECDDGRRCDGVERCAPRTPGADERGCVRGKPVACPVNQICTETHGCVGTGTKTPKSPATSSNEAPAAGAGEGASALPPPEAR